MIQSAPLLVPLGVVLMLLLGAVVGPLLVRGAAPALVRAPRLALALLPGATLAWVGTLLSLGPVLAWAITGPAWMPASAAHVCQQCLSAASPFAQAGTQTALPTVLLLVGPLLMAGALLGRLGHRWLRRLHRGSALAQAAGQAATPHRVGRTTVQVIESDTHVACAVPGRPAQIVLSTATLRALTRQELLAVVEHERAHLTQRHHAVAFLARELAAVLPFIPLVRAVADAVPHYLEIAADAAAARRVGTSALAGALLQLGEPQTTGQTPAAPVLAAYGGLALHAAGPGRVQHLLAPVPARHGATAATGFALGLSASLGTVLFISGSYLAALLTGCAL